MAYDDDMGDLYGDQYDGFDINVSPQDTGERQTAKPVKKILTASAKGVGSGVIAGTKGEIARQFPYTSGVVDEAVATVNDFKTLKSDIGQAIGPAMQTLRQSALRVMPFAKKMVPTKLYDKIETKLKEGLLPTEEDEAAYTEKMRSDEIATALNNIFVAQNELDKERRVTEEVDKQINRQLDTIHFNKTSEALASIDQRLLLMNEFYTKTSTAYMKKSLELKYQHLFVAKDTFSMLKGLAGVLEARLADITKNTGLPEFSKVKMGERIVGSIKAGIGEDLAAYVANLRTNVIKNIRETIMSPLSPLIKQGVPLLAIGTGQLETARAMGMLKIPEKIDAVAAGTGLLGRGLGWIGGTKLTRNLAEKAMPWIEDTENTSRDFRTRSAIGLRNIADRYRAEGGIKGFLAGLVPQFRRDAFIDNTMLTAASEPVPFDNTVRQTIVEVLPRHLERIGMYTEGLAKSIAPDAKFEYKLFNVHDRALTSVDKYKEQIVAKSQGSAEQRAQNIARSLGTFEAAFDRSNARYGATTSSTGEKETSVTRLKTFEEHKKNIRAFIVNSGTFQQSLRPDLIKAYAETGSMDHTEYIKQCFSGISEDNESERRLVASLLKMMLFRPDGTLEPIVAAKLSNVIMEQITSSTLMRDLAKYTETLGAGVAVASIYDRRTGLRPDAIRGLYEQDYNNPQVKQSEQYGREYAKRDLDYQFGHQDRVAAITGIDPYGELGTFKNNLVSANLPIISTLAKMMPTGMNDWLTKRLGRGQITPETILQTPESIGIDLTDNASQKEPVKETIKTQLSNFANDPEARVSVLTELGIKDATKLEGESEPNYLARMSGIVYELYKNNATTKLNALFLDYKQSKIGTLTDKTLSSITTQTKATVANLREGMPDRDEVLEAIAPEHRAAIAKIYDSAQSVEDFITKSKNVVTDPATWKRLRKQVSVSIKTIKSAKRRKHVLLRTISSIDQLISKFNDKQWRGEQLDNIQEKGKHLLSTLEHAGDRTLSIGRHNVRKLQDEIDTLTEALTAAKAAGNASEVERINNRLQTCKHRLAILGGTTRDIGATIKNKTGVLSNQIKSSVVQSTEKVGGWWQRTKDDVSTKYKEYMDERNRTKAERRKLFTTGQEAARLGRQAIGGDISDKSAVESKFHHDFRIFAAAQLAANEAMMSRGLGGEWGRHPILGAAYNAARATLGGALKVGAAGIGAYGRMMGGLLRGGGQVLGGALSGAGKLASGLVNPALLKSATSITGSLLKGGGMAVGGLYQGVGSAIGGLGHLAGGALSGAGQLLNPFGGALGSGMTNMYRRVTRPKYFDVYLKDKIEPGQPLLTAKAQEAGLYFADGKRLKRSMDIIAPIFEAPSTDGESPKCVVTQDDIKRGLCDAQGRALREVGNYGISPVGNIFSGIGNLIRGGTKIASGIAGFWERLLTGGASIGVGGAKGFAKMLGRAFGLDLGANKEYQDKMTELVTRIVKVLEGKHVPGDWTGDGIREGSVEDQLKKLKEEKSATDKMWFIDPKTGKKLGFAAAVAAGLCDKTGKPKPGVESGSDSGVGTGTIVGSSIIGSWLAGKMKPLVTKPLQTLARKVFGSKLPAARPPVSKTSILKKTWDTTKAASKKLPDIYRTVSKVGKTDVKSIVSKAPSLVKTAANTVWKGARATTNVLNKGRQVLSTDVLKSIKSINWTGLFSKLAKYGKQTVELAKQLISYISSLRTPNIQSIAKSIIQWLRGLKGTGQLGKLFIGLKNFLISGMGPITAVFEIVFIALDGIARADVIETGDPKLIDEYEQANKFGISRGLEAAFTGGLSEVYHASASVVSRTAAKEIESASATSGRQMADTKTKLALKRYIKQITDSDIPEEEKTAYLDELKKLGERELTKAEIKRWGHSTSTMSDKSKAAARDALLMNRAHHIVREIKQTTSIGSDSKTIPEKSFTPAAAQPFLENNMSRQHPLPELPTIQKVSTKEIFEQKQPIKTVMDTPAAKSTASGISKLAEETVKTNTTLLQYVSTIVSSLNNIAAVTSTNPSLQKTLMDELKVVVGSAQEANTKALEEVGKLGAAALAKPGIVNLPTSGPSYGTPAGNALGVDKVLA